VSSSTAGITADECTTFASGGKVKICRRTNSPTNPYTPIQETVDACIHHSQVGDYPAAGDPTCGLGCLSDDLPCDPAVPCCDGSSCQFGNCEPSPSVVCDGSGCPAGSFDLTISPDGTTWAAIDFRGFTAFSGADHSAADACARCDCVQTFYVPPGMTWGQNSNYFGNASLPAGLTFSENEFFAHDGPPRGGVGASAAGPTTALWGSNAQSLESSYGPKLCTGGTQSLEVDTELCIDDPDTSLEGQVHQFVISNEVVLFDCSQDCPGVPPFICH
jgi:hypothetical protein